MFLIKLPWKIFCYFLDGVLRVALLTLLLFLLAQHSDSVLANVQDITQGAIKQLPSSKFRQLPSEFGSSLKKIKSSISKLSSANSDFSDDKKSAKKNENVTDDSSKSWFQAKIY